MDRTLGSAQSLRLLSLALTVGLQVACNSSSPAGPGAVSEQLPGVVPEQPGTAAPELVLSSRRCKVEDEDPVGVVDPDLVGTWIGPVDGSGGPDTLTLVLAGDGTFDGQGTTPFYSHLAGPWRVKGEGRHVTALGTSDDASFRVSFSWTVRGSEANTMSGFGCGPFNSLSFATLTKQ
jgi:hypothetical protein